MVNHRSTKGSAVQAEHLRGHLSTNLHALACNAALRNQREDSDAKERFKVELHSVERLCANELVAFFQVEAGDLQPLAVDVAENLECAQNGVQNPKVSDAFACVNARLFKAIDTLCAVGEDLADPIGRQCECRPFGEFMESLASPACEVGGELVGALAKVKLRLGEDDPTTGPTAPPSERAVEICTQVEVHIDVWRLGPSHHLKNTVDEHRPRAFGKRGIGGFDFGGVGLGVARLRF